MEIRVLGIDLGKIVCSLLTAVCMRQNSQMASAARSCFESQPERLFGEYRCNCKRRVPR